MKQIEVSDAVFDALTRLAGGSNHTPNDVIADLLNVSSPSSEPPDELTAFILSADFRARHTDADKYLGLLSWLANRHRAEFGEFILSLSTGRRYLSMDREEILAQCRHNQARQIPGTPFWAIMNLDTPTKRRFLARVMEFCGYADSAIDAASQAIGMRQPRRKFFFGRNRA